MFFTVNFDNVATSATGDLFKTMAALIAADTLGFRCRLRKLMIGPSDDAPADLNVAVQIKRVDDVSAGNAGTADSNPTAVPHDSLSRAAVITTGVGYLVGGTEPTTYGLPLAQFELNRRATAIVEWDADTAPVIGRDQLLGVLAAPPTAAAALLSGSLTFEEF